MHGRNRTRFPVTIGVNCTVSAHRDDHARYSGLAYLLGEGLLHLCYAEVIVFFRKEYTRLLKIAHKARILTYKVAASYGNRHI